METGYRSYVVRIWRRGDRTDAIPGETVVRVLVEEVQSGRQADLRGHDAVSLAAAIGVHLPAPSPSVGIEVADRSEETRR